MPKTKHKQQVLPIDAEVTRLWHILEREGMGRDRAIQLMSRALRQPDIENLNQARIDTIAITKMRRGVDRIDICYSFPSIDIDEHGVEILDHEVRKEIKMSDREEAAPEFYAAIEFFVPYIGTFIEQDCLSFNSENSKITKVGFPVMDSGEEGLFFAVTKKLTNGQVWNFCTPTWWADPPGEGSDRDRCYAEALKPAVAAIQEQARLYISGVRAQGRLTA